MLTPVDAHYYTTAFIAEDNFQPGDKLYVFIAPQRSRTSKRGAKNREETSTEAWPERLRMRMPLVPGMLPMEDARRNEGTL